LILALAMIPPWLISLWDQAPDRAGISVALLITLLLGGSLALLGRYGSRGVQIGHREGFLIVALGWIAAGLIGALPYWLYAHLADGICLFEDPLTIGQEFCSWTNSAFESISGFSTTGASIISDGLWGSADGLTLSEPTRLGLPRGILLWRSMTHFLGGMGIIVLGVAILPLLGVGGMQLLKAEVPGPTTDKLVPQVGETARLLWKVYALISVILFLLLWAGGMSSFEAVCHSMATMATGGFSTRAESVMGFHSAYTEWVITLFMFIAGVNFTLHFAALQGRFRVYFKDLEFWIYSGIALLTSVVGALALYRAGQGFSFSDSLRWSAFQMMSICSTTGFASHNFEEWTYAPAALLAVISLMFVGGMAGSTGGGIKVVRHILMVKMWVRELFLLVHPKAKRAVTLNDRVVSPEVMRSTASFMAAFFALTVLGTVYFIIDGQDLLTAFTCSISSIGNIGPGLGKIGPYDNYACLGTSAKWFSMALMVFGRLEIYTLLVLLTPSFWRR